MNERIDYDREPDDGWRDDEADYARHEFARAAALAARLGHHSPDKALEIERGLCEVAGLTDFHLAA